MFLGHYAVALGAKPLAPKASLGSLLAAAAFLDLVWPVFVLAGLEVVRVDPAATKFTPLDFVSYPYSHSLLTSVGWGLLFGGIYMLVRRDARGAVVLAALVVSHWILDLIVHRPDLPLTLGDGAKYGLGLWNEPVATAIVELTMLAAGLWLYAKTTWSKDKVGSRGLAGFVVFVLAIYAGAALGPPPPSAEAVAWSDLGQLLIVILAAWIDRHRQVTT